MLSRQQTRHGLRGLAQLQISEVSKLPRKVRRAMAKKVMQETIKKLSPVKHEEKPIEKRLTTDPELIKAVAACL